ncbi:hypothetical protein DYU11_17520 [Fibrisoma montanum]|uniref:Ig-like domain-containing protein n=1 Tax=Fibrisoma montanum TaxID=2305895 RepID=A0A418M5V4_9BACT|nr:right-handed parallel beta-helix repeat-containing protein [Fibrisoma montanum]RIV21221.1 hypothetical protein DYU11_17520 [Fibrisoma montanum]
MYYPSCVGRYGRYILFSALYGFVLTLSIASLTPSKAQSIRFVKPVASGTGDGSSWSNASADLQAIINASNAGDQVWVAAGTYKPGGNANTDRTISFSMKNGVALYGGFEGTETALSERPASVTQAQPSTSILSGDLGIPSDRADNSRHIISNTNLDNTAILDGFVITAANLVSVPNDLDRNGGGMRNLNSTPTVRNCFFTNNYGEFGTTGGGMYNDANSKVALTNCTFDGNSASSAAISSETSLTLIHCTFTTNRGSGFGPSITGGAVTMNNCILSNNTTSPSNSGGAGGVARIGEGSIITNCVFSGNGVAGFGGALYITGNSTLTNCTFRGNQATGFGGAGNSQGFGGAIYSESQSTTFTNCSFSNNFAGGRVRAGGGAIYNQRGNPQFINCSFANNTCDPGGAMYVQGGSPVLINCIIWGNTPNGITNNTGASTTLTYTDTQDNTPGTGNFSLDPLFVDVPGDNLRLRACSPAIDKGDNQANTTTTDVVGTLRLVRSIDLGAYEFQGTPLALAAITQPPNPVFSIPQGGTLTTSVSTTGSVTAYQWYKDNTALTNQPSATTSTLTISPLSPSDAGTYYVVVMGSCNSVRSTNALVLVNTGMYSVKAGAWNDPGVWSENRVPTAGDRVRLKHVVSLPAGYQGQARQVSYDPGQRLQYGANSRLKLNQ